MSALELSPGLLWTSLVALVALGVGTATRLTARDSQATQKSRQKIASMTSWWCIAIVVIAASTLGSLAIVILMAMVSLLAHHEFARLHFSSGMPQTIQSGGADSGRIVPFGYRKLALAAFAISALGYLLLAFGDRDAFISIIPLLAVAVPSMIVIIGGNTSDSVAKIGRAAFSILILSFALGHAALLAILPHETNQTAGPSGWFLFLVAITQINDIAQALVGRRIGRRHLTPISPGKTWEGFIGGAVVTTIFAIGLSRLLTPMSIPKAFISGILIAIAGLLGDLNMSLVKRDAGAKDSGTMIPGQGGILDRIDSLTFTAPVFYYFVLWS